MEGDIIHTQEQIMHTLESQRHECKNTMSQEQLKTCVRISLKSIEDVIVEFQSVGMLLRYLGYWLEMPGGTFIAQGV
jgi:hypothetical protein